MIKKSGSGFFKENWFNLKRKQFWRSSRMSHPDCYVSLCFVFSDACPLTRNPFRKKQLWMNLGETRPGAVVWLITQCLRFWYSSHWLSHNESGHQSTEFNCKPANKDYVNEGKTNCLNWISDKQPDQFIKEWLSNSPQLRMNADRLISERAPCEKSCLSCDSDQWCFSDWTKTIDPFFLCLSIQLGEREHRSSIKFLRPFNDWQWR